MKIFQAKTPKIKQRVAPIKAKTFQAKGKWHAVPKQLNFKKIKIKLNQITRCGWIHIFIEVQLNAFGSFTQRAKGMNVVRPNLDSITKWENKQAKF